MLSKLWKPIGIFILIVASLFSIVIKLVNTSSLKKQVNSTVSTPIEEEIEEVENE